MGLNATVRKLLTRNPGSSAIDAARVRNSAQVSPTDVANSITSVQRQIDAVVTVALADQTVSDPITVSGEDGGQIGWIGTVVQNTVSYLGMWFQNFWLGGTSPATAQIYSDSLGDVFIDGAEIVNTPFELNLNGVTTSIENLNSAVGVLSIKSLDNTTSYYSGATPTGFELLDNLGNSLGSLRSSGASGHLDLSNVAGTNTVNLITGGGGAPKLSIASAAGTVSMSPGTPLSVFGNTVVDSSRNGSLVSLTLSATGATAAVTQTSSNFTITGAGNATFVSVTALTGNVNITSGLLALNGTTRITNAGNAAFAQVAVDLKAAAVTGTSGGTGVGNAMLSATTAGLFLSLNGAAPVALGAGGGTVTSVALTAPAQFAVTGTPITSAGTLAIAWNNQTANTILAGPASGGAAAPTFRALVAADIAGLATPAGATTQVQYNNAGAFGASANFAWNNATNVLTIGPANTAGTGYAGTIFNSSATAATVAFQTSAGTFSITGAGNAAFQQVALALKASAVTGTGGGTGVGNAMLSATTAGLYLSLNGAAPVALGSGTVTSVALTAPSQFAVTGSPITSSGTLAIAWNNQTANTVLAGPASGAAAAPTYRALVAADIAGLVTPAGSTTQVQYNNAGAFGASANFAWNNATNILTVGPANTAGTGYVGTLFNSSATGTTAAFQTSAGTFSITGAGNAAFQQVALALKATAVIGTSGGTGVGNAMLSATTAGLFLSLNGAAAVACLTTSSLTAGTGISIAGGTTITNTGIISLTAGTGISVAGSTITNTGIISLTAGAGISVAGSTITNNGIISLTAGTGISVAGSTITNTGVLNYSPGIKVAAFSGTSGALATFANGIYVYDSAGAYKGMIPLL